MVQWLRLCASNAGARVRSLAGKLKSHTQAAGTAKNFYNTGKTHTHTQPAPSPQETQTWPWDAFLTMPLNIHTDNQRVILDGVEMLEARSGIFSKGFGASPQERKASWDKNELCGRTHSQQEGGDSKLGKAVRKQACRLGGEVCEVYLSASGFLKGRANRYSKTPDSRPHTTQVSRAILPHTGASHKRPAHRGRLCEEIRYVANREAT